MPDQSWARWTVSDELAQLPINVSSIYLKVRGRALLAGLTGRIWLSSIRRGSAKLRSRGCS